MQQKVVIWTLCILAELLGYRSCLVYTTPLKGYRVDTYTQLDSHRQRVSTVLLVCTWKFDIQYQMDLKVSKLMKLSIGAFSKKQTNKQKITVCKHGKKYKMIFRTPKIYFLLVGWYNRLWPPKTPHITLYLVLRKNILFVHIVCWNVYGALLLWFCDDIGVFPGSDCLWAWL